MSVPFEQRLRGGVWGLLVGDALGVPYEFHRASELPDTIEMEPPAEFDRAHRAVPPGTYSDDGAQALALLASLTERGALDPDDFARRLVGWYERGEYAVGAEVFDVGVQTGVALRRLLEGVPALEAGPSNERSNGNGSLMRVLPLALFHRGSDRELIEDAFLQSRVTHGHARSRAACALYCLWARRFLGGSAWATPDAPWHDAVAALRGVLGADGEEREALEFHLRPDEPAEGRGSGYVIDSLRSARMLVERHDTYEATVIAAVKLGDDTDTTAAIAGGIAGVRGGLGQIPARWRARMRDDEAIEARIEAFLRARGSR